MTKKNPKVKNTTTHRTTTKATVTSKAATEASPNLKDKSKAVIHSNRRSSENFQSVDPVPLFNSTRQLRPRRGPKASANSYQREERDPEPNASRHHRKRQSGRADNPRKTPAIGRGAQHKVSSKSITDQILAPVDNAVNIQPQLGPCQEEQCASGSRQLLTKETLEQLARGLKSIDTTDRNSSAKEIGAGYSGEETEDESSQEIVIDTQEQFNRKWGYVPPLDEETTRIIEAIITHPARAQTMVGIGPENSQFLSGLHNRNVLSEPSTQLYPCKIEIQSISLEGYLQETQEQEILYGELWKLDKAKCTPDSSEALYQRTLMINLIARHLLIYQINSSKEQIFDFSVEEPWGCLPIPSRLLWAIPKRPKV